MNRLPNMDFGSITIGTCQLVTCTMVAGDGPTGSLDDQRFQTRSRIARDLNVAGAVIADLPEQ